MGLPCTHYMSLTHHISFLCEDGIVETLQGHPFVRQLHIGSVVLSEVASSINVLSQTKVPHPDTTSRVQPGGMYKMKPHLHCYGCYDNNVAVCVVQTMDVSLLMSHGTNCHLSAHMQFLAARSRWTNFCSAK